jgi:hypothetical protein
MMNDLRRGRQFALTVQGVYFYEMPHLDVMTDEASPLLSSTMNHLYGWGVSKGGFSDLRG